MGLKLRSLYESLFVLFATHLIILEMLGVISYWLFSAPKNISIRLKKLDNKPGKIPNMLMKRSFRCGFCAAFEFQKLKMSPKMTNRSISLYNGTFIT